jgi:hypothetical protein
VIRGQGVGVTWHPTRYHYGATQPGVAYPLRFLASNRSSACCLNYGRLKCQGGKLKMVLLGRPVP